MLALWPMVPCHEKSVVMPCTWAWSWAWPCPWAYWPKPWPWGWAWHGHGQKKDKIRYMFSGNRLLVCPGSCLRRGGTWLWPLRGHIEVCSLRLSRQNSMFVKLYIMLYIQYMYIIIYYINYILYTHYTYISYILLTFIHFSAMIVYCCEVTSSSIICLIDIDIVRLTRTLCICDDIFRMKNTAPSIKNDTN